MFVSLHDVKPKPGNPAHLAFHRNLRIKQNILLFLKLKITSIGKERSLFYPVSTTNEKTSFLLVPC